MTESAVSFASANADGDEAVGYSFERNVIDVQLGFKGVAGREWARYHANTEEMC